MSALLLVGAAVVVASAPAPKGPKYRIAGIYVPPKEAPYMLR